MFEDDTTPSQSTQEDKTPDQPKYTKTKKAVPSLKVGKSNFQTKASIKKKSNSESKMEAEKLLQKGTKAVVRSKSNGSEMKKKNNEKMEKKISTNKTVPLNSFTKCVLEALFELNKLNDNE